MYFYCNIKPHIPRTEREPLSRIRAFFDDLVLLFFAKFRRLFQAAPQRRVSTTPNLGRNDGQPTLHFNDKRWYIATIKGRRG
jgi:hypothetical protein